MIACVVVPHFAVTVHRAGGAPPAGPLVLVRYGRRGSILAASPEAEVFGIHPGLSLSRARALCPSAQFVTADLEQVDQSLDHLLEALWTFTNRVEVDSDLYPRAAVCYLDLGNLNESDTRF